MLSHRVGRYHVDTVDCGSEAAKGMEERRTVRFDAAFCKATHELETSERFMLYLLLCALVPFHLLHREVTRIYVSALL